MSPNEKQIEQILTNYFSHEMPDAIRQLPKSADIRPKLKSVTVHKTTPRQQSFSVSMGLVVSTCALLIVAIVVGISVRTPATSNDPPIVVVPETGDSVMSVENSSSTKPVEMQKSDSIGWVKKIETDKDGNKVERIEPHMNLIPKNPIILVPLDDDEEEE